MHVWDEFSEFLPENRVPTSADFNTYPIRIFIFTEPNMLVLLVTCWLHLVVCTWAYGPSFVRVPSQVVLYSNNTGLILDCVARGDPPPIIDWVDQNGNILSIHPSYAR